MESNPASPFKDDGVNFMMVTATPSDEAGPAVEEPYVPDIRTNSPTLSFVRQTTSTLPSPTASTAVAFPPTPQLSVSIAVRTAP